MGSNDSIEDTPRFQVESTDNDVTRVWSAAS